MDELTCSFTGIGSLPFTQPKEAVHHSFSNYEIHFLPQLPLYSIQEHMIYQFLEDFPGFVLTPNTGFIDIEKFEGSQTRGTSTQPLEMQFSFSFLSALPFFLEKVKNSLKTKKPIKIQVTSPYTIGSNLLCSDQKLVLDHPDMYRYLIDFICHKTECLMKKFDGKKLLVFFDEPMLSHRNSGEVLPMLNTLIQKLKQPNTLFGLHSCNRWTKILFENVFQSKFDIISFNIDEVEDDVFENHVLSSLPRQKWLMWGIIPTVSPQKWKEITPNYFLKILQNKGLKSSNNFTILSRSLFSPSCGTGRLNVEQENRCASLLKEIAHYTRRELKT